RLARTTAQHFRLSCRCFVCSMCEHGGSLDVLTVTHPGAGITFCYPTRPREPWALVVRHPSVTQARHVASVEECMNRSELESTARRMAAEGKGILAADESTGTIKKRFDVIKLESTEETRRTYREMLFTTPGAAEYISGVIFYDETLRQKTKDGVPFPEYLTKAGIVPGIKVDTGAKPLAGFPGETITEGLDGLRERFAEYYTLGARFAKWRAVIDIGSDIPTRFAIEANAHALARYAALAQEASIVPIVEPEVLMDGAHTLERCEEVTSDVLATVFQALHSHRVHLE